MSRIKNVSRVSLSTIIKYINPLGQWTLPVLKRVISQTSLGRISYYVKNSLSIVDLTLDRKAYCQLRPPAKVKWTKQVVTESGTLRKIMQNATDLGIAFSISLSGSTNLYEIIHCNRRI